jgi:hypothetical protein
MAKYSAGHAAAREPLQPAKARAMFPDWKQ